MNNCLENAQYIALLELRDFMSHRGKLPRNFFAGGEQDGMATMPANPKAPGEAWKFTSVVDEQTTEVPYQFVKSELNKLVAAAYTFCKDHF